MMVFTSALHSGDALFLGVQYLHHTYKPMKNSELTLDQFTTISGGVIEALDGSTCIN